MVRVEAHQALNGAMEFDSKTFDCAINLLPKESELSLTFYPNFMIIEVPQEKREYAIKIYRRRNN